MHSMSASMSPRVRETVCSHTFCMWLHCFDMLSYPNLQMKTAHTVVQVGMEAPQVFT